MQNARKQIRLAALVNLIDLNAKFQQYVYALNKQNLISLDYGFYVMKGQNKG